MGDGPPQRMPVNMALKMLISPKEGACILGPNGSYSKQIADRTGVRLQLSQKGEFYPGTQMQELCIRGAANDMVLQGVMQVISRMSEDHGRIFGVETDVEEGGARVHFVVPVPSANAFKGIQGENMRYIQGESGMKIHVEDFVVGSGEMAEQVVSCAGPLRGLEVVVSFLLEKVAEVSSQPWFRDWAFNHKACPGGIPGQAPKGGAGGHGGLKGGLKGPPVGGCSLGGYGPAGYAKGGKDAGKMGGKGYASAPVTPAAGMQLLKGALSALPSELANPMDQSQVVQYLCPANLVANVGNSLLEISGATATHIDVRDAPGNPAEKAITISGNAVGCCVAYLHVVSRFSGVQPGGREMMQPVQQMQQGFNAPAGAGMNCMGGMGNMCGMGGMNMGCMGNTGNGGMCCMGGMGGAGSMGAMGNAGNMGNMGNTGSMGNMGMVGSGSFL